MKEQVCVVGLGYMGIPTALLIARAGIHVLGKDVDNNKLKIISDGKLPFQEKGLSELFDECKRNLPTTNIFTKENTREITTYIVCVPTPFTDSKKCDLKYVTSALMDISKILKKGDLVILESTVSPGTTTGIVKKLLEQSNLKAGQDFDLAYISEKAIPGNTIYEMINNDRIIGGINEPSKKRAAELYSLFVKGNIHLTDCTTAETTKLIENAYRDVNIAFANELALICEALKINVWETINLANKHPRVNVHLPGPGVGGHCIAIDPWFLIEQKYGKLIRAAREINDSMPKIVFDKTLEIIKTNNIQNPAIGILGIAYKKNVDDVRLSPAEPIINLCLEHGFKVLITDPFVEKFSHALTTLKTVINESNVILIITDHDEYINLDLTNKHVLNTRNMKIISKHQHTLGNGKDV